MPAHVARILPIEIAVRAVRIVGVIASVAPRAALLILFSPHAVEAALDTSHALAKALVLARAVAIVLAARPGAVRLARHFILRGLLIDALLGLFPSGVRGQPLGGTKGVD